MRAARSSARLEPWPSTRATNYESPSLSSPLSSSRQSPTKHQHKSHLCGPSNESICPWRRSPDSTSCDAPSSCLSRISALPSDDLRHNPKRPPLWCAGRLPLPSIFMYIALKHPRPHPFHIGRYLVIVVDDDLLSPFRSRVPHRWKPKPQPNTITHKHSNCTHVIAKSNLIHSLLALSLYLTHRARLFQLTPPPPTLSDTNRFSQMSIHSLLLLLLIFVLMLFVTHICTPSALAHCRPQVDSLTLTFIIILFFFHRSAIDACK